MYKKRVEGRGKRVERKMKIKEIGELGLIDKIARQTKTDRTVIKGIGDDTAVLKYSNKEYLLFTTDMLLEGVHFSEARPLSEASPEVLPHSRFYNIGWKSLACSISDIAAMGGVPQYCLISVGLPPNLELKSVEQLYSGIKAIARKFKINVVGGDTIKSKKLIINITLLGRVSKKKLILRSGAREGDAILVTGDLGASISEKNLTFTPRLKEAQYLANNFKLHSMIDISDGLILDLYHIIKDSRKGARLYLKEVPISPLLRHKKGALKQALYGGEDFELLFTTSKRTGQKIAARKLARIIGEITDKKNSIESSDGTKLNIDGYQHFHPVK